MKILIIGASGTIGQAVIEDLAFRHDIIDVGKESGQYQVDISSEKSVRELFAQVGKVDAIIVAAGDVHWGPLKDITAEQFRIGIDEKLLGQVNVTLVAQEFLNDGGSITLTSGSLSHDPYVGGASFTTVNNAIDGFVRAAAIELGRDRRINAVSPHVLEESWEEYGEGVPGTTPVPANKVALAYRKSVEGQQTGQTYRVW